jgi:hypothetical protein
MIPLFPSNLATIITTAQEPRPKRDQNPGIIFSAQVWAWLVSTVRLQITMKVIPP